MNFKQSILSVLLLGAVCLYSDVAPSGNGDNDAPVLGLLALNAGDYERALTFLRKVRDDVREDSGARGRAVLAMAYCMLQLDRYAECEKLLDEMRERYPEVERFRAGFLRSRLSAAKGEYDAALTMLESLKKEWKLEHDERVDVPLLTAEIFLAQGKYSASAAKYAEAVKAAGTSEKALHAYCGEIFALIMGNELTRSRDLLNQAIKNKQDKTEMIQALELFQMAREKRFSELYTTWNKRTAKLPPGGNRVLFLTGMESGRHFVSLSQWPEACFFYSDAYARASNNAERRSALQNYIDAVVAAGNKPNAIRALDKYLEMKLSDQERFELLRRRAAILVELSPKEAVQAYRKMTENEDFTIRQRLEAAASGVALVHKHPDDAATEFFYLFLAEHALTRAERNQAEIGRAELRFRRKQYKDAMELLTPVAAEQTAEGDNANILMLRCYLATQDYASAQQPAQRLLRSRNPAMAATGAFHQGMIDWHLGRSAAAEKSLTAFASAHPDHANASEALLRAADLAFDSGNYTVAFERYARFVKIYAKSNQVPYALYRATESATLTGKRKQGEELFLRLRRDYPANEYTFGATLREIDYLRGLGENAESLRLLEELEDHASHEQAPQLLYERARILAKQNNQREAIACLGKLQSMYPTDTVIPDAYFLEGDLYADCGQYPDAVRAYIYAARMRPGTLFELMAKGRAGDVCFGQYTKYFDPKALELAMKLYVEILAAPALPPAQRVQTYYKIGRGYEAMNQFDQALECYRTLLIHAAAARSTGDPSYRVWTARAGYAALRRLLRRGKTEDGIEALKILKQLEVLGLASELEFAAIKKELTEKFKL